MDNLNVNLTYKYLLLYRGQLASKKLTLAGAKKLANQLMREKGWAKSDIKIVLAPPDDKQGGN